MGKLSNAKHFDYRRSAKSNVNQVEGIYSEVKATTKFYAVTSANDADSDDHL